MENIFHEYIKRRKIYCENIRKYIYKKKKEKIENSFFFAKRYSKLKNI